MREHGVLERVLLIYEEGVRRLEAHEVLLPENLADAATVVRAFVEDYHEKTGRVGSSSRASKRPASWRR